MSNLFAIFFIVGINFGSAFWIFCEILTKIKFRLSAVFQHKLSYRTVTKITSFWRFLLKKCEQITNFRDENLLNCWRGKRCSCSPDWIQKVQRNVISVLFSQRSHVNLKDLVKSFPMSTYMHLLSIAKIGFDTAKHESFKVRQKVVRQFDRSS